MINKIDTIRTIANNLKSHLIMEGKTKIKKPGMIIPGAVTAIGTVFTLETKDNNALLIVQKDDNEIQRTNFSYNETPEGYELVSAKSSYLYDNKDNKEIRENHYVIEPEREHSFERSVNYANAPIKEDTNAYIDKINSSMAQTAGYKSGKTVYDSEESHTYGKKSLQRDLPALLKFLDVIAPDSEFTLKMKDKLKKDNKTSLFAFEANNIANGNEIVRGFMSSDGDSVSYHIDTENMTIIGEQGPNKDFSKAYLKPEKTEVDTKVTKEPVKKEKINKKTDKTYTKNSSKKEVKNNSEHSKTKEVVQNNKKAKIQTIIPVEPGINHVYSPEYYINNIYSISTNKKLSERQKIKAYAEILADAYKDGYDKPELGNFLFTNRLFNSNFNHIVALIEGSIDLAERKGDKLEPVKTLDIKINELQNIEINTDDEELEVCIRNIIDEIKKIKDSNVKEIYVEKALNILQNNSKAELLSFIKETGQINDDFKLHYEVYEESVLNKKIKILNQQIEKMINNISDTNYHDKRDEFLSKLYITKDLNELVQLKKEVRNFLQEQASSPEVKIIPENEPLPKLSIQDLSGANQKIVKKLLNCKSPRNMTLSFNEVRNLLLDIGFEETNVNGTHYKFLAPSEIILNGRKQSFITVAYQGTKETNPGQISDLISVCKQYYDI